jgi:hypothetical protein
VLRAVRDFNNRAHEEEMVDRPLAHYPTRAEALSRPPSSVPDTLRELVES